MNKAIETWKTIEIGVYDDVYKHFNEKFRDLKKKLGITQNALDTMKILSSCYLSPSCVKRLDLVKVSLNQLGLFTKSPLSHIYAAAHQLGFCEVPGVAAFELRCQYLDQPPEETIHIGMTPILVDHHHDIFSLDCRKRPMVRVYLGNMDGYWAEDTTWIFVKPH